MDEQLTDIVKEREALGRERADQLSELALLEASIATAREKHAKAMAMVAEQDQQLVDKLRQVDMEREELDVNILAYQSSRESNERLRMEVYEARNQAAVELRGAKEEEDQVRSATLRLRLALLALTKKALEDAEDEYRIKATQDVRGDAVKAQAHNKLIKIALDERTKDASAVMRNQRTQASKLRHSLVEKDLLAESVTTHDVRFGEIVMSLDKAQRAAAILQADVSKIQAEYHKAQRENSGIKNALLQINERQKHLDELRATTKMRKFRALSRAKHLITNNGTSLRLRKQEQQERYEPRDIVVAEETTMQRYSEEELQRMWKASRQKMCGRE